MILIGYDNVVELTERRPLNLENLTTGRFFIDGKGGWQNVKFEEKFYSDSINACVSCIGFRGDNKNKVAFYLRNNPVHSWWATRIDYYAKADIWSYTAGQCGRNELSAIRKEILKLLKNK